MKFLLPLTCLFMISFMPPWETDFEKAKQIAKEKHALILLNFSGSDWCGPCIRMKKEFFENGVFSEMAEAELVLINADFPRLKKNKPAAETIKQNDLLADRYNPEGKFPFTLLLNAEGKVIYSWDGLPDEKVNDFVLQIKGFHDANKQ